MQGSRLNANDVEVTSMQSMMNGFDVAGAGSMARLENITFARNDLSGFSPPIRWVGVNVRENAMASISDVSVTDSTNIRHVVASEMGAVLDVDDVVATNLKGGREVVSAIFNAVSLLCRGF